MNFTEQLDAILFENVGYAPDPEVLAMKLADAHPEWGELDDEQFAKLVQWVSEHPDAAMRGFGGGEERAVEEPEEYEETMRQHAPPSSTIMEPR